jgi:upstream activation factor subunit UAF30
MRPQQPDAVLAAIVGPEPRPRTEITKRVWAYIKAHGLQDPTDRRVIFARTPEFRALLQGANACSMFQLPQFVFGHTTPAEG